MPKLKATVEVVYDFVPEAYHETERVETVQEARETDSEFLESLISFEEFVEWLEREGVTYMVETKVEICQS